MSFTQFALLERYKTREGHQSGPLNWIISDTRFWLSQMNLRQFIIDLEIILIEMIIIELRNIKNIISDLISFLNKMYT